MVVREPWGLVWLFQLSWSYSQILRPLAKHRAVSGVLRTDLLYVACTPNALRPMHAGCSLEASLRDASPTGSSEMSPEVERVAILCDPVAFSL